MAVRFSGVRHVCQRQRIRRSKGWSLAERKKPNKSSIYLLATTYSSFFPLIERKEERKESNTQKSGSRCRRRHPPLGKNHCLLSWISTFLLLLPPPSGVLLLWPRSFQLNTLWRSVAGFFAANAAVPFSYHDCWSEAIINVYWEWGLFHTRIFCFFLPLLPLPPIKVSVRLSVCLTALPENTNWSHFSAWCLFQANIKRLRIKKRGGGQIK